MAHDNPWIFQMKMLEINIPEIGDWTVWCIQLRLTWLTCMHAANSKVVAAWSILIMGGGPVGVEMAGEMVTDFPDKKVKIHFLTFWLTCCFFPLLLLLTCRLKKLSQNRSMEVHIYRGRCAGKEGREIWFIDKSVGRSEWLRQTHTNIFIIQISCKLLKSNSTLN